MILSVLVFSMLSFASVGAIECWLGSNRTDASDNPPVEYECPGDDFVCMRGRSKQDGAYLLSCSLSSTCQLQLGELEATPDASLYTEITCCDTVLCNGLPSDDDDDDDSHARGLRPGSETLGLALLLVLTYALSGLSETVSSAGLYLGLSLGAPLRRGRSPAA
jgi:hypothetical protein